MMALACSVIVALCIPFAVASNDTIAPPVTTGMAPRPSRTRTMSQSWYHHPVEVPQLPRTLPEALAGTVAPDAVDGLLLASTLAAIAGGLVYPPLASKARSIENVFASMNCDFDPRGDEIVVGPSPVDFVLVMPMGFENALAAGAVASTSVVLATFLIVGTLIPPPAALAACRPGRVARVMLSKLGVVRHVASAVFCCALAFYTPNVVRIGMTLASHGAASQVRVGAVVAMSICVVVLTLASAVVWRINRAAAWASVPRRHAAADESSHPHERPRRRRRPVVTRWVRAAAVLQAASCRLVRAPPRSLARDLHVTADTMVEVVVAAAAGLRPAPPLCTAVGAVQAVALLGHMVWCVRVQATSIDEVNFFVIWVRFSQFVLCALVASAAIRDPASGEDSVTRAAGWVATITVTTIAIAGGFLVYHILHAAVEARNTVQKETSSSDEVEARGDVSDGSNAAGVPMPTVTPKSYTPEQLFPDRHVAVQTIPKYTPPKIPQLDAIPSNPIAGLPSASKALSSGDSDGEGPSGEDGASSSSAHSGRGATHAQRYPKPPPGTERAASRSVSPPSPDDQSRRRRRLVNGVARSGAERTRGLRLARPQYRGTPPPPDEERLELPPAWDPHL